MCLFFHFHLEVSNGRVPPLLLPEWEIVTEAEPITEELREQKQEKSDEENLSEYERLVQEGQAGTLHGKFKILRCALCVIGDRH